jgi:hypothetical protein
MTENAWRVQFFFGRAESHYFASCLEGIALGAMMAL